MKTGIVLALGLTVLLAVGTLSVGTFVIGQKIWAAGPITPQAEIACPHQTENGQCSADMSDMSTMMNSGMMMQGGNHMGGSEMMGGSSMMSGTPMMSGTAMMSGTTMLEHHEAMGGAEMHANCTAGTGEDPATPAETDK